MKHYKKKKPWITVLLIILVLAISASCVAIPLLLPKMKLGTAKNANGIIPMNPNHLLASSAGCGFLTEQSYSVASVPNIDRNGAFFVSANDNESCSSSCGNALSINLHDRQSGSVANAKSTVLALANTVQRTQSNATLRTKNTLGASVYTCSSTNEYTAMNAVYIPNNARVTLLGDFNARGQYTLVAYFGNSGRIEGYVLTSEVEKDDFGVIEAVAVALIIISLAVGVVVFLMRKKNKI